MESVISPVCALRVIKTKGRSLLAWLRQRGASGQRLCLVLDCLDVLSPLYLFDYLQHKAPFNQAGNKCFLMRLRGLRLWRLDKRPEPMALADPETLRAA